MQKVYYRFIAWIVPLTWVLAVWVLTAAIWAASTKTDAFKLAEMAAQPGTKVIKVYLKPLWMALIWIAFTGLFEWVAWHLRQKINGFYRWSDQEWWNYNPEDAPGNFPAQLGDFVDY